MKVAVVERGPLPLGASTRNAGFACFGSMTELLDDLQHNTPDEVFALVERRWKGLLRLRQRIPDAAMDYQTLGGFELFRDDDMQSYHQCLENLEYINRELIGRVGAAQVFRQADDRIATFGFQEVQHLIWNGLEGQLHPGKMMQGLLKLCREAGVELWFGLPVDRIDPLEKGMVTLTTQQGWQLKARRLLIATNGFAKRLAPELDLTPARNQVMITTPIPGLPVSGCFHYDRGYYYFRNVGDRLLVGGGRHLDREGESTDRFGHSPLVQKNLLELTRNVLLPHVRWEPESWWSGILGIGPQKRPIIKMIAPGIGVSVRLGGMGVAIGSLVGEEGAQLLLEN